MPRVRITNLDGEIVRMWIDFKNEFAHYIESKAEERKPVPRTRPYVPSATWKQVTRLYDNEG